jgi:hypothetical protein
MNNYTGDGFTEEYDDGWPIDAHPDEVEYDNLRTTYPDLPEYHESDEADPPTRTYIAFTPNTIEFGVEDDDEISQDEWDEEYDDFFGVEDLDE